MMEKLDPSVFLECDYIDDDFVIFKGFNKVPIQEFPTHLEAGVLGICLEGKAEVEINLNSHTLEKNCVILMRAGDIVMSKGMDPDFTAIFVAISSSYLQGVTSPLPIQFPLLLHLKNHPMIKINEQDIARLLDYYEFIWKQVKNEKNTFRRETVRYLLQAMVTQLWSILLERFPNANIQRKDRKNELTEEFFIKLQQNYMEERSVNFYADALYVTPKHLSTVVKTVTGRTTSDWIDDFVILEAKAKLKNSNHSVQRIALDLNFSDQSFFAKFFKKHTGVSPSEYRMTP